MPTSPPFPEDALRESMSAMHAHAAKFLGALPLRDTDFQALLEELARSPQLRQKIADLQQRHLRKWVEIMRGEENRAGNDSDDRRFAAPEWHELPWFKTLRDLYLLNAGYLEEIASMLDIEPSSKSRLAFVCKQLADAMSPANNPATNPQALKQAFESGGQSFARGAQAFAADLARGRISMTDESAFEVGRNIATTPGDVVFENELIQLIQYRATTSQVYSRPLLIVPPFINKYYILDLQESNSFVGYCVEQGMTTFIVSWRNISEDLGHLTWDDYLDKGVFEAIDVVKSICGSESINTLGFCVGGTLLASALAVAAARETHHAKSLTLLAAMLDFSDCGEISVFVDGRYVEQIEQEYAGGGVLPGSQLASAFSSLRANELVWYFVINNYLLGRNPRAFDLLHWNTDSSNLPGPLYAYYLRNMYLENSLRVPGALRMKGMPVDLGAIDIPALVVATRDDHIVPWKTAYRSVNLLGGKPRFILGASGHVAGIVNPASANRRNYWIASNEDLPPDPDRWQEAAHEVAGSWWNAWMKWLKPMAGKRLRARKTTGNKHYPPLEPAPGRYVRESHEIDVG